jgi:hypothetical protein
VVQHYTSGLNQTSRIAFQKSLSKLAIKTNTHNLINSEHARSTDSMAALVLQPYSSTVFNTLHSLHDADAEFKERNAATIMNSVLAGIFTKHNVNSHVGVQLLHRHFRLDNDERLVDAGGASVPWSNEGSEALDSRILPVSWAFEGFAYHPYEFKFFPPTQELHEPVLPVPFLVEFNEALKAHNLQGVPMARKPNY